MSQHHRSHRRQPVTHLAVDLLEFQLVACRTTDEHPPLGKRSDLKFKGAVLVDNSLDRLNLGRARSCFLNGVAAVALGTNDIQVSRVIGNLVLDPLKLRARVE